MEGTGNVFSGASADGVPYIRRQEIGRSLWHLGWLITLLATGKDTRGKFTLAKVISRPGTEPPAHLHRNEDETFFVVEGEMSFTVADRTFKAPAGTSVFLPRGVPHSFEIDSDQVRALCLLVPAGLEGFFEELSEPAETLTIPPTPAQLDMEKILSVSTRHGIEYVNAQEAPSAPVHPNP